MDGTTTGKAGGDVLRTLDEKIEALIQRVRDLVRERDTLLAEIASLRKRLEETEAVSTAAAEADASWRHRARGTASALRSAIEELRAG